MNTHTISVDLVPYTMEIVDPITIVVHGLGNNECFLVLDQNYIRSKTRFTEKYCGIPLEDNFCGVVVDGSEVRFELAHPDPSKDVFELIEPVIQYILNAAPSIEFEVLQSYTKWCNS